MSGDPEVSSTEIAAAAQIWSIGRAKRRCAATASARSTAKNPDPKTVIRAFGKRSRKPSQGVKLLARAYFALGSDAARAVLSHFGARKSWKRPTNRHHQGVRQVIPAADHRFRMERMLYAERAKSAQRVASLAGAKQLADAWAAVLRNDKSAGKLLEAVPAAQRSAGYLFAEAKYLRAQEVREAAAVMLKAPSDKVALVDPDAWWTERRVLSRELVDHGDIKTAYQLVAAHSAEKPATSSTPSSMPAGTRCAVLTIPSPAARHFARIAELADGPMSLSRAYYWLGRAAEAGGPGNARPITRRPPCYGTTFYGQLAAERIGSSSISRRLSRAERVDRQNFAAREAVRAIRRLERQAIPACRHALPRPRQQLTSPGELALLAVMAEKRGNHFLALRVGKIAASRGIDIGALSHPVGVIPASANISGSGKALAYAIARQESEFNVGAVSGAGARGLLQLLPGTARNWPRRAACPTRKDRLTTDAGYNATLGAAFLSEQLGRFDGSYVLTFAGYNAGPRRAREWIANTAIRAARASTRSSTGSSESRSPKQEVTCSA